MTPYYVDDWLTVYHGDARAVMSEMPAESVNCVVTSPPYWGLRDYGEPGQLGLEATPEEYVAGLVDVFREVRRVLRADGTVWLNLGDSYNASPRGNTDGDYSTSSLTNPKRQDELARGRYETNGSSDGAVGRGSRPDRRGRGLVPGLKPKDLVGIPWMVAFALRADGWYLRSDIIWSKPNPMPESVTDRPTKSHEYLFLLSKSPRYYFDGDAVAERSESGEGSRAGYAGYAARALSMGREPSGNEKPGMVALNGATRNIRSVWQVATQPYPGAHFATFPPKLIEPCIKAGCPEGGVVLDPFAGSGTTGMVAQSLSRRAVLIDLSMDYLGQLMDRNRDIPLGLGA